MRSIDIAGTGLFMSRLGFGLSGLHHLPAASPRQRLLSAAFDYGINYFDTAPYYGHGIGERELGIFSRHRRDRVIIATKFGIPADPWFQRFPWLLYSRLAANVAIRRITGRAARPTQARRTYGADAAVLSLEASLKALHTDHVDILYLHEPTLELLGNAAPLLDALDALKRSGKVRHIGLSGSPGPIRAIVDRYPDLKEVLQVDASSEQLGLLLSANIPFHATYGHFRGQVAPIETLLDRACAANRCGVILFSTRRVEHLHNLVTLLDRRETA
jgi:aryl-alcohol dehydrogenase-like predicted oxidoreductase